ncbi:NIL domain-containing protein, partial [Pseudomonas aeruginosa]|uniref:NIL domain-containing protein n=1 Tax=Pseudomonas aeruginosa TaxID=287 RepID=UPI0027E4CF8E
RKNNPLLVGEAGVGKTAIAEGLAKRSVEGRVPDLLAIARAIGQRVDLLHGGIERIQGRALGRLLLQVGAPPGELPGVLAKAALVADKVEVLGHVAHA